MQMEQLEKKWIFIKTAFIYLILPSSVHWWLYQSISGEILTNCFVKHIFLAQKMVDLDNFKDWWSK